MKEQLITFETAKLAKEKGFILPLSSDNNYFNSIGNVHPYKWFSQIELADYISAPTQSLLQKWLREKHNIDIYICGYGFGYYPSMNNVPPSNQKVKYIDRRWNLSNKERFSDFVTYEQALEKGLQEALKLIKWKKN